MYKIANELITTNGEEYAYNNKTLIEFEPKITLIKYDDASIIIPFTATNTSVLNLKKNAIPYFRAYPPP